MSEYTRISNLVTRLEQVQKSHGDLFVAVSVHPDMRDHDLPDITDVTVAHDKDQTEEQIVVLHVGN